MSNKRDVLVEELEEYALFVAKRFREKEVTSSEEIRTLSELVETITKLPKTLKVLD